MRSKFWCGKSAEESRDNSTILGDEEILKSRIKNVYSPPAFAQYKWLKLHHRIHNEISSIVKKSGQLPPPLGYPCSAKPNYLQTKPNG